MVRPFLALCLTLLPGRLAAAEPETAPGELIVHWKSPAHRHPLARLAGRRVVSGRAITPSSWVYRLEEKSRAASEAAIAELRGRPEVALVEANLVRRPFRRPNDTLFALQWYAKVVNLEAAWDRTTGVSSTVVAVIDTGILSDHPDLAGRVLPGYDFISDETSAGDGGGWDSSPVDAGTEDVKSSGLHGLHVAGIIGATSNNNRGVAGVNWACKLLPVRALGVNGGRGSDSDIAAAIRWAAGLAVPGVPANPNPARVLNLSFGGPGITTILTNAVTDALKAGAIIVAAAGNHGIPATEIFPAALPGVITVGATGFNGKRAPYSNYGEVVEIVAPGGTLSELLPTPFDGKSWPAGIVSTLRLNGAWAYHFYEGTSQAAPIVSGVVSLMLALDPELTADEVTRILTESADPAGKCAEGCGAGMLDAAAAVQRVQLPATPDSSKLTFSAKCTSDDQCAEGVCRDISDSSRICTRFCTLSDACPEGSTCQAGLCVPGSGLPEEAPSCQGESCAEADPNIIRGGCALAGGERSAGAAATPLLPLLVALLVRRRRLSSRTASCSACPRALPSSPRLEGRERVPTLERWYYRYRRGGLAALRPGRRRD